ncbi:F-box protein At2g27310-like [Impatiens glandulifera]|uniref:F-box protein At2g27310-like n=1 Tax=Impatiens glandulifera TaxID=253017 RepID=UPI001FB0E0FF|nr:F-box protein At2g27310-like [Impatiens glandulifera]
MDVVKAIPYSITTTTIPNDLIFNHILPHLDGVTLATVSSSSRQLHSLSSHDHLWRDLCHRTWPSTAHPLLQQLISTFPSGHTMFYADSYPALIHRRPPPSTHLIRRHPQTHFLISAVDIQFGQETLFSKVESIDTESKYFLYSEFLVTVLGFKERVTVSAESENWEEGDHEAEKILGENLKLSWIIIDPESKRSGSVSTQKPVSVNRHWLTGEVELEYSTVFAAGNRGELVKCAVVVTCGGGGKGGRWHVKEVSMKMEDIDGKMMKGKECMEILQDALERGERKGDEEERKKGFNEYMEMVMKRKEKNQRKDGLLDLAAISFFLTIFIIFFLCFLHFSLLKY